MTNPTQSPAETKLYLPKPGERVRLTEVTQSGTAAWAVVGAVVEVKDAWLSSEKRGFIVLHIDTGANGAWCRVEPVSPAAAVSDLCDACGAGGQQLTKSTLWNSDERKLMGLGDGDALSMCGNCRTLACSKVVDMVTRRRSLAEPGFKVGDEVEGESTMPESEADKRIVGKIYAFFGSGGGRYVNVRTSGDIYRSLSLSSLRLIRRAPTEAARAGEARFYGTQPDVLPETLPAGTALGDGYVALEPLMLSYVYGGSPRYGCSRRYRSGLSGDECTSTATGGFEPEDVNWDTVPIQPPPPPEPAHVFAAGDEASGINVLTWHRLGSAEAEVYRSAGRVVRTGVTMGEHTGCVEICGILCAPESLRLIRRAPTEAARAGEARFYGTQPDVLPETLPAGTEWSVNRATENTYRFRLLSPATNRGGWIRGHEKWDISGKFERIAPDRETLPPHGCQVELADIDWTTVPLPPATAGGEQVTPVFRPPPMNEGPAHNTFYPAENPKLDPSGFLDRAYLDEQREKAIPSRDAARLKAAMPSKHHQALAQLSAPLPSKASHPKAFPEDAYLDAESCEP